jgi:hypothetical protein
MTSNKMRSAAGTGPDMKDPATQLRSSMLIEIGHVERSSGIP